MHTELCKLMKEHGSDKATWHNYTLFYYDIFLPFKDKALNFFELGLGTKNPDIPSNMKMIAVDAETKPGGSLRAWGKFFSNAIIYGADIDRNILFQSDRIHTFYCDQTDPKTIYDLWNNDILKNLTFDIIIDDGLHTIDANICFLQNSLKKLSKDGVYIIEDISLKDMPLYNETLLRLTESLFFNHKIIPFNHDMNNHDNAICLITHEETPQ